MSKSIAAFSRSPPLPNSQYASNHPAHHRYSHFSRAPRRLMVQLRRCLITHPDGADTTECRPWAYGGKRESTDRATRRWQAWNIRRALRRMGATPIGRRGRALVWRLLDDR